MRRGTPPAQAAQTAAGVARGQSPFAVQQPLAVIERLLPVLGQHAALQHLAPTHAGGAGPRAAHAPFQHPGPQALGLGGLGGLGFGGTGGQIALGHVAVLVGVGRFRRLGLAPERLDLRARQILDGGRRRALRLRPGREQREQRRGDRSPDERRATPAGDRGAKWGHADAR